MKKQTLTVAVVLLVVAGGLAGMTGAVSPSNSVPADVQTSDVDQSTVVVALANPDTTQGQETLLAANAIAAKENATVLQMSTSGKPSAQVISELKARLANSGLRHAIVVGANESNVSTAVNYLDERVNEDGVELDTVDEVSADSTEELLETAVSHYWTSGGSDALWVTSSVNADIPKTALALTNDSVSGTPVLLQKSGSDTISDIADLVGASTIYVTPGVSDSVVQDLKDAGYTVDKTPQGVTMSSDYQSVAADFSSNTSRDVFVVNNKHRYAQLASQVGSMNNSSVVVTKNSTTLGDAARKELSSMTGVENVVILGSTDSVSEDVATNISSEVRQNATVRRVSTTRGYTQLSVRTELLTAGHKYAVMTTYANVTDNDKVMVEHVNVGFSATDGNVTSTWQGDIQGIEPHGTVEDGTATYETTDSIDAGESYTVTLDADSIKNGGHPSLKYEIQSTSGGGIAAPGGIVSYLEGLPSDLLSALDDFKDYVLNPTNWLTVAGGLTVLFAFLWVLLTWGKDFIRKVAR